LKQTSPWCFFLFSLAILFSLENPNKVRERKTV
jgi:hypothetical protein